MTVLCNDAEDFRTHGVNPLLNHLMIWWEDNDNEADCSHALVGLLNEPYCSHFCTFQKTYTMGGQLKHLEPAACDSVKNDVEVWNILLENGITTFLERMAGYSALVSYAVMASWSKGQVQIGNTRFTISTNAIADATGLPAAGDIYFRRSLHAEMQDFIAPGDKPVKYLSGYTWDFLPPPWNRVAEVIMRYFTMDGRYQLVYSPHFFILSHLHWGKKINLVAFLFQSLEHSGQLAHDEDGAILHQGLLYLLFSDAASHADLIRFPPKTGRRRRSPSPSPRPSSTSLRSSRRRHRLHLSSDSDSDVAILSPPLAVSKPPVNPVFPPHLSCLFLEGTDTSFKAVSPVSSPDSSLAADILGLAKLYPDSPDLEQLEKNQPVDDPTTQAAGNNPPFDDRDPPADTRHSSPNLNPTPAEPETANTQRDDRRVDMVSSILNKLQRAFKALKAWEAFTESTKSTIAKDCSELITLAEQLADDSGSPRARTAVSELKKLL
ncbi:hypothetical protein KI387_043285 [Taxus chinensis]|uniref:Uncharacterized protein n=1 Tax=Taxus chinensis TaxID=29808 RepID=A0AA38BYS9_TAXCH|nr:hypothetical protein KI387_043285 [Taxus chinensis]